MQKPKSRGKTQNCQDQVNKQNKTILKLDVVPEPINTTLTKMLYSMDMQSSKKLITRTIVKRFTYLLNYARGLLVIAKHTICTTRLATGKLWSRPSTEHIIRQIHAQNDWVEDDFCNWETNGSSKHKFLCQKVCQSGMGIKCTSSCSFNGHNYKK